MLTIPGYLLFPSAMLMCFVFPASEPTRFGAQPVIGMTALQAVTLVALGTAWFRWAVPALQAAVSRFRSGRRQAVVVWGFMLVLAVVGLKVFQANQSMLPSTQIEPPSPLDILPGSSPPSTPSPPRTLEELTKSADMIIAANVIEFNVERFQQGWDELVPINRDALCAAGKAIRSAMHAYNNTLADLDRAQRAIYDITAASGRCRLADSLER
jgi:hypothetical protein